MMEISNEIFLSFVESFEGEKKQHCVNKSHLWY